MKLSFNKITIEQFKKLIATMSNEDFCFFINHLMEVNFTDNILLPIFKSKYGDYQWLSYFSENGKPYDDNCAKIIDTIKKFKDDFDFVLINEDSKCIFFSKNTFKYDIFNLDIFETLYNSKEMWVDKCYSNGELSDGYDFIINCCDISVLFKN